MVVPGMCASLDMPPYIVARIERSEMRGAARPKARAIPGFAALNPGYDCYDHRKHCAHQTGGRGCLIQIAGAAMAWLQRVGLILLLGAQPAAAQNYPARPVTIAVP